MFLKCSSLLFFLFLSLAKSSGLSHSRIFLLSDIPGFGWEGKHGWMEVRECVEWKQRQTRFGEREA